MIESLCAHDDCSTKIISVYSNNPHTIDDLKIIIIIIIIIKLQLG
jgi:hypothetical protein